MVTRSLFALTPCLRVPSRHMGSCLCMYMQYIQLKVSPAGWGCLLQAVSTCRLNCCLQEMREINSRTAYVVCLRHQGVGSLSLSLSFISSYESRQFALHSNTCMHVASHPLSPCVFCRWNVRALVPQLLLRSSVTKAVGRDHDLDWSCPTAWRHTIPGHLPRLEIVFHCSLCQLHKSSIICFLDGSEERCNCSGMRRAGETQDNYYSTARHLRQMEENSYPPPYFPSSKPGTSNGSLESQCTHVSKWMKPMSWNASTSAAVSTWQSLTLLVWRQCIDLQVALVPPSGLPNCSEETHQTVEVDLAGRHLQFTVRCLPGWSASRGISHVDTTSLSIDTLPCSPPSVWRHVCQSVFWPIVTWSVLVIENSSRVIIAASWERAVLGALNNNYLHESCDISIL